MNFFTLDDLLQSEAYSFQLSSRQVQMLKFIYYNNQQLATSSLELCRWRTD